MSTHPSEKLVNFITHHSNISSSTEDFRNALSDPANADLVAEIKRKPDIYTCVDPFAPYCGLNACYVTAAHVAFTSCNAPSLAVVLLEFGYDPLDFLVKALVYIRCSVATNPVVEAQNLIACYHEVMTEEMRQSLKRVVNEYPRVSPILSAKNPNTKILKATGTTVSIDPTTGKPRKQLPSTLPITITPLLQAADFHFQAALPLVKFLVDELGADLNASMDIERPHYVYSSDFVEDDKDVEKEKKKKKPEEEEEQHEETEENEEEEEDQSDYRAYCDGLEVAHFSPFALALRNGNSELLKYILSHPKFSGVKTMSPEAVSKILDQGGFLNGNMFLLLLSHFPYLSRISSSSCLASVFFGHVMMTTTKTESTNRNNKNNDHEDNENENQDENDGGGDEQDENVKFLRPELDTSKITSEDFANFHCRVFGKSNPERRGLGNVLIEAMVKSMVGAYSLRAKFDDGTADSKVIKGPVFCYDRFGCSIVCLGGDDENNNNNDDENESSSKLPSYLRKKYLLIGGEHEDAYDPDFQIYNDVFVFDPQHRTYEMFAYPREAFSPTDFHTATLVPHLGAVFIIGNVGYADDRVVGYTPVYRLDLMTMRITKIETKNKDLDGVEFITPVDAEKSVEMFLTNQNVNDKTDEEFSLLLPSTFKKGKNCGPGWISEHLAYFIEDQNEIAISCGKVLFSTPMDETDIERENNRRSYRRQEWEKEQAAKKENAKENHQIEEEIYQEAPFPTTKQSFDKVFMNDKRFLLNLDTWTWRWEKL